MASAAGSSRIRYVWFDQDDTLYSYQDAMQRALCECLSVIHERFGGTRETLGPTELVDVRREISDREDCAELDLVEARCEAFHETLNRFARPDRGLARMLTDTYFATLRADIRPFPGVAECLRTLRDSGYVLGILSNGISHLDALRLADFFDHGVYAMDVLLYKPDPAIFEHAMSLVDARPEQCLLVGDSHICDVVGAHRAGWTGVWLNSGDDPVEASAETPAPVVSDLSELPPLIDELNRTLSPPGEHPGR